MNLKQHTTTMHYSQIIKSEEKGVKSDKGMERHSCVEQHLWMTVTSQWKQCSLEDTRASLSTEGKQLFTEFSQ